ncbi:MAG: glycosyltransferase [Rhodocyclaceae bacterium]|nr:glycosyltransferase [Rhodocyclaceae bacterium]
MKIERIYNAVLWRLARLHWLLSPAGDREFVLTGEKGGAEARDNGFAYFEHRIRLGDKTVYFVTNRNNIDSMRLAAHSDRVVQKNSLKHFHIFLRARLLILNDGPDDVFPTAPGIMHATHTPILYLQHGIIRYKRVFFSPQHYDGRIVRFVVSSRSEYEIVRNFMTSKGVESALERLKNNLWEYPFPISRLPGRDEVCEVIDRLKLDLSKRFQSPSEKKRLDQGLKGLIAVKNLIGLPESRILLAGMVRHKRLLDLSNAVAGGRQLPGRHVVIFLTWREYWPQKGSRQELMDSGFLDAVRQISENPSLQAYVTRNDLVISIYLHSKISCYSSLLQECLDVPVRVINGDDLQSVICESCLLITDYSSVAFDFVLVGRPVVFYQFDLEDYRRARGWYVRSEDDWVGLRATNVDQLTGIFESLGTVDFLRRAEGFRARLLSDYPYAGDAATRVDMFVSERIRRISFVCYNIYGVGGTVRSVTNIANALVQRGIAVTIVSVRRTSERPILGLHPSVRVIPLLDVRRRSANSKNGIGGWRRFLYHIPSLLMSRQEDLYKGFSLLSDLRLIRLLRGLDEEVVITTFPSAARIVHQFKRRSVRLVVQEHKFFDAHPPKIASLIRKTYPVADLLFTLTEADKKDYSRLGIKRVVVLGNGTADMLLAGDCKRPEIKRIVALGRLDPQKQFDLLIKAFNKALQRCNGWILEIYGDGPERHALAAQIEGLGLAEAVFLRGNTDNSIEVLSSADFCAVSSSYEGFGMVFIEAFSVAKPVVTFDIERGPKEIVVDEENGLKAKCFEFLDYSNKLYRLMVDEDLRHRLGLQGYATFRKKYDIEAVTDSMLESLEESVVEDAS